MTAKRVSPVLALLLGAGALALPARAEAFCGFYVAGADAELHNRATVVVLLRDGQRTVLSMQNNYEGPPEDFAMVVPVPVVLGPEQVRVLPPELFARVDRLAAPRLVELWQMDPCAPEASCAGEGACAGAMPEDERSVVVEARFAVGEYDVAILSAKDSAGLESWLERERYAIPEGAEALLRPYVEAGSKFFVAKVDVSRVEFDASGKAKLSPLRMHYDAESFSLPIRLGRINAPGEGGAQDLLIHILARGERYRVANYPNVTIPTNLDVRDEVRHRFGEFYASLFDQTLAQNPGAVVTEYAWSAASCDPCADEPLTFDELVTLGADLLPSYAQTLGRGKVGRSVAGQLASELVLTRLHARYDGASIGDDLIFEVAPALQGGRELWRGGELEQGAEESPRGLNNFQARYVIRHPWTGATTCADPAQVPNWGAPPSSVTREVDTQVVRDPAFAVRGAKLGDLVAEGAAARVESELGVTLERSPEPAPAQPPKTTGGTRCSVESPGEIEELLASFGLLGLYAGLRRRRRRS